MPCRMQPHFASREPAPMQQGSSATAPEQQQSRHAVPVQRSQPATPQATSSRSQNPFAEGLPHHAPAQLLAHPRHEERLHVQPEVGGRASQHAGLKDVGAPVSTSLLQLAAVATKPTLRKCAAQPHSSSCLEAVQAQSALKEQTPRAPVEAASPSELPHSSPYQARPSPHR